MLAHPRQAARGVIAREYASKGGQGISILAYHRPTVRGGVTIPPIQSANGEKNRPKGVRQKRGAKPGVLACPGQEAGCAVIPVCDDKGALYTFTSPAIPVHN